MNNLLLWFIVTIVFTFFIVVVVSYIQSKNILRPPKYKKPLNFFPDIYNLVYEPVTFKTADNITLRGWFIPAKEKSDKTIILLHGWASNKAAILPNTYFLHKLGFNLFYFDFRRCGESSGETSTIGYLEIKDFEAAMDFLSEHKSAESSSIGIYAISMGASVAIYNVKKYSQIKCVVAEAAFASYAQIVTRWAWVKRKIPYYPCIPITLFFVKLKLKADPEKYSPIYHIDKLSPKPIFFIHGSHDNLVLAKDAKRLFEKAGEPKSWWLVAGATHGKCSEVGGQEYIDKMSGFFKKYL